MLVDFFLCRLSLGNNQRSLVPPANEEYVQSVTVFDRLTAIFAVRQAFIHVENSLRLKKALKVQPQKLELYNNGDQVITSLEMILNGMGRGRSLELTIK